MDAKKCLSKSPTKQKLSFSHLLGGFRNQLKKDKHQY